MHQYRNLGLFTFYRSELNIIDRYSVFLFKIKNHEKMMKAITGADFN